MTLLNILRNNVIKSKDNYVYKAVESIRKNQDVLDRYREGKASVDELIKALQSASVTTSISYQHSSYIDLRCSNTFTDKTSLHTAVQFNCKHIKESEEDFV